MQDFLQTLNTTTQAKVAAAADQARQVQTSQGVWNEDFTSYGWMGAAMWYNKLAEMNGALIAAVQNAPHSTTYPTVMEDVNAQRQQTDAGGDPRQRFRPYQGGPEHDRFRRRGR